MSVNKILNPGFGIGSAFGTPTTIGLTETSTTTLTGTAYIGQFHVTGFVTGTSLVAFSTSTPSAVTGTWTLLSGAPGWVLLDGASHKLTNTTTSATIVLIKNN